MAPGVLPSEPWANSAACGFGHQRPERIYSAFWLITRSATQGHSSCSSSISLRNTNR